MSEKPSTLCRTRSKGGMRSYIMGVCLIVGVGLLSYPVVGTLLNEQSFSQVVGKYQESTSSLPDEVRKTMIDQAHRYNESLRGDPVRDPFIANSGYALPSNYDELLNVDNDQVMGTISIPIIDVLLPIYHGTSTEVLEQGVGHIPQTSLPVGGPGTHAVLTGHTGFPTARLFDDLVKLKLGDVFVIEVLGEKHAYEVDDIRVVDPDEVSIIRVDDTHDMVTLLTCTPYGINSHRLLVRGSACALPDELPTPSVNVLLWPWLVVVGGVLVGVLVVRGITLALRRRRTLLKEA